MASTPIVTELFVYPIKSCAGLPLDEAHVGAKGIVHDREWMVVTSDGSFVTQREIPSMCLIRPRRVGEELVVEAPGMEPLQLPVTDEGPRIDVTVWDYPCRAIDQGAAASRWFSEVLGGERGDRDAPFRLVRMPGTNERSTGTADARLAFADFSSFLIVGQSSLDGLNQRLEQAVAMARFRPNVVVSGCPAHDEDDWLTIDVGEIGFRGEGLCFRCPIPQVDPGTGSVGKEPTRTLLTYRQGRHVGFDSGPLSRKPFFGKRFGHLNPGTLRVGDRVRVRERGR